MKFNKFVPIVFLTLLAILFSSCSKNTSSDKKIFNLNISQGIETLEPVMSNSAFSIWGVQQVMEGLVEFDKDKNIIPCIAKSWTISTDGITYTFNLRSDVKFHDDDCFKDKKGRAVTASDFKYCLERVNNPKSKTRGLWVFRDKIKGAKEFSEGKANEITGIKAVNDSTLQIELYSAFSPFLSLLTMTYGFVYPKEAVDFYGEKLGFHPVGTGPFKFNHWSIDKELVLDKNPNYWEKDLKGNALPYLDGVKITFTQSSETEFLDFQNGKYDFHQPSSETFDVITDESGKLKDADTKNFTMVKQPWLQTVFLGMMQSPELPGGKTGPFAGNKKLREALNYAIDKDKIVKFVLKN
ncbi:MAG: ABC transporter substrate-binding protein, partial [Ignavibacteria bacterium]|nr:ABC transporter substrate-binding protein [Ignavibacteria bacterium]